MRIYCCLGKEDYIRDALFYNFNKINQMEINQPNLLTFLKKQSLFSNSPSKNASKKRSRSKDRSRPPQQEPSIDQFSNKQPKRPNERFETLEDSFPNAYTPSQQNNNSNPKPIQAEKKNKYFDEFDVPREVRNPEQKNIIPTTLENRQANNVWKGVVTYATNFESARVESVYCLQTLSSKLKNEMNNITHKLDDFNNKILRVISSEFKNLKERIGSIVEQSFRESEQYIREYMKVQQEKLASDLIKMRETLHIQYKKIEEMKEEINKPGWRKVAGEVIANDLERTVDQLVKKSSALEIGRWELGDLVGYRIKDLEKSIKDVVRLKRQPVAITA